MTRDQAQFILEAFRPGGGDAKDAVFCEALRNAEADPVLRAWFERSRAHDSAVAVKLGRIMPPAGLREAILAGARVSGRRRGLRRRLLWGAGSIAVALAAIAAVVTFRQSGGPVLAADEREAIAGFALDDMANGRHGGHGEETGALQAKLASAAAGMPRADEIDFAGLRATGCRTLRFQGRELLEVCFKRHGTWFHLYIFDRPHPEGDTAPAPSFLTRAGGAAAVWVDGQFEFTVVSKGGLDAVRSLF